VVTANGTLPSGGIDRRETDRPRDTDWCRQKKENGGRNRGKLEQETTQIWAGPAWATRIKHEKSDHGGTPGQHGPSRNTMTRRQKTRVGRKNLRRQNEERLQRILCMDRGDEDKSSAVTENETFAETGPKQQKQNLQGKTGDWETTERETSGNNNLKENTLKENGELGTGTERSFSFHGAEHGNRDNKETEQIRRDLTCAPTLFESGRKIAASAPRREPKSEETDSRAKICCPNMNKGLHTLQLKKGNTKSTNET
jgi:hypothetical protein